jgi:hypothetical protein
MKTRGRSKKFAGPDVIIALRFLRRRELLI